jgi:hypothetical protein
MASSRRFEPPALFERQSLVGETEGQRVMNHSIIGADRNTHVKMVVVALVAAIMVVTVGIGARLSNSVDLGTDILAARPGEHPMHVGVIKATKSPTFSSSETRTVR